nr:hypothetical protein [Pseudodesulfovibrio sp.]
MEELVRKAGSTSVLRMGSEGAGLTREQTADKIENLFGTKTPVTVLDHRNPLLTASLLMDAVEKYFEDSQSPLVSTVTPDDHPVQLRTLYNVVDVGMIHLLDTDVQAIETLPVPFHQAPAVTKPFYFDWRIVENSDLENVVYLAGENGLVLFTAEDVDSWSEVWIKESSTTARIALAKRQPEVCGHVSSSVGSYCHRGVFREGNELFLYGEEDNSMMQLVPFTREGLDSEFPVHISLRSVKTRIGEFESSVSGFAYTVQQSSQGGQYTHESLYSPANGCWCARTQRDNEGCKLSGRQRFPSIFQVDPSLFIGTVEQLRHLNDLLSSARVRGFELGNYSCLIQNPIDILRYTARFRCVNDGGNHDV